MNIVEVIQNSSFFILAIISVISSFGVVFLTNLVWSAFLLGAVLLSVAGVYLLLNADFLAAAQILLYVGAINILILFAIMLVKNNFAGEKTTTNWVSFVKTIFPLGLFAVLYQAIKGTPWLTPPFFAVTNTVEVIGRHIFSDFLLPFELVSLLLLVALIGAVILARREQLSKLKKASLLDISPNILKDI